MNYVGRSRLPKTLSNVTIPDVFLGTVFQDIQGVAELYVYLFSGRVLEVNVRLFLPMNMRPQTVNYFNGSVVIFAAIHEIIKRPFAYSEILQELCYCVFQYTVCALRILCNCVCQYVHAEA